jgi:uncharacterized membrane protein YhaH (DUF805 family)
MDIMHLLFSFDGRIRRLHYWMAAIASGVVIGVVVSILMPMSGVMQGAPNPIFMVLLGVLYVVDIWIGLALGVKRCHDRDKAWWWILIFGLVSLTGIGALWPLIELGFLDGTQGPNQYGPSPKGIGGADPTPIAAV